VSVVHRRRGDTSSFNHVVLRVHQAVFPREIILTGIPSTIYPIEEIGRFTNRRTPQKRFRGRQDVHMRASEISDPRTLSREVIVPRPMPLGTKPFRSDGSHVLRPDAISSPRGWSTSTIVHRICALRFCTAFSRGSFSIFLGRPPNLRIVAAARSLERSNTKPRYFLEKIRVGLGPCCCTPATL
jgi:hypothetical protein